MRRKILILSLPLMILIFQNISSAQKVEVGFRFSFPVSDLLFIREYIDDRYKNLMGNPYHVHLLLGIRINDYLIPELRGGFAVGDFTGWEAGLFVKSYFVKETLYGIATGGLHWNAGGGSSMPGMVGWKDVIYKDLFEMVGIGIGLQFKRFSLELLFLKSFKDLGYTRYNPGGMKIPIKFYGLLRLGFGFAWEL